MRNYFFLLVILLTGKLVAQHTLFSANDYNIAFLSQEGYVYCSGDNAYGQLGIGPSAAIANPVRVKGMGGIGFLPSCKQISLEGFATSLALSQSGDTVFAWGKNDNGELGIGNYAHQNLPVRVKGPGGFGYLQNVKQICTGGYTSYALMEDGTVLSWGQNIYGELGCNNTFLINSFYPVPVLKTNGDTLRNVKYIVSGGSFAMALLCDGTVWTWGRNHRGQLGQNNQINSFAAIQVKRTTTTFLTNVSKIESGDNYSYALANDTLFSWGNNVEGQLGEGDFTNRRLPVYVRTSPGVALSGVVDVAAGQGMVFALLNDGTLRAWGNNDFGQLGNNDTTLKNATYPIAVVSPSGSGILNDVNYIVAGDRFCFARTNGGELYAWGQNANGQLALGDFEMRLYPTKINVGFTATSQILPFAGNLEGPSNVCYNLNTGNVWLRFNSWKVKKWQVSTDGFLSFTDYSNAENYFAFQNIQNALSYRVVTEECGVEIVSSVHTILVDPRTLSGAISSESRIVERGSNHDSLRIINQLGDVKYWQHSRDNFMMDSLTIAFNTLGISFTNLDSSRYYRVAVKSGTCPLEYTAPFKIHVIGEEGIRIYNGFTPNGDEYNDEWIIDSLQYFRDNKVEVFDRQGDLVFHANAYDNITRVWKGQHQQREVPLPDGTYFYRISPGPFYKTRTGFVVISR